MDSRDYSGSMYPPQEPTQEMANMAYMAPPSQFGFANMYMDMSGYNTPAGHYPPYPMTIYAPGLDAMAHQQAHQQQPKKKMTFNKNANFKPNAYNAYGTMNNNAQSVSLPSSKFNDKGLEYRFEVGNSAYFNKEALKETYPIYINTDYEEFLQARERRLALRQRISEEEGKKSAEILDEAAKIGLTHKPDISPSGTSEPSEEVPSELSSSDFQPVNEVKNSPIEQTLVKPLSSVNSCTKNVSVTESMEGASDQKTAALPAQHVKSWSKLSSGSLNKSKPITTATSLSVKKEKKYIPPNVKNLEPLGSVALRICFDKNYTMHTLQNTKANKLITDLVPRGIINKGSICFISSVLQLLIHCRSFANLLNVIHVSVANKSGNSITPLLDACLEIFKNFDKSSLDQERSQFKESGKAKNQALHSSIITANNSSIDPEQFYKSISKLPKFKDLTWGRQEDAEEFLTHLLDQLHEEFIASINILGSNDILNILQSLQDEDQKGLFLRHLSKYKASLFTEKVDPALKVIMEKYKRHNDIEEEEEEKEWKEVSKKGKKTKNASKRITEMESSPISTIFGGQFRSVLDTPQNKESQSITYDPFQTIQMDISSPEVVDLESAFKKFSEHELIELKSSSGNDVEAKKQTCIDKLPQVLLLQLKRFSFVTQSTKGDLSNYNSYNGRIEKISKMVKYGHEIIIPKESISPFLAANASEEELKYTLSGVIYHHGLSPSGGHYTCDVFNKDLGEWYRIDDVKVEKITNKDDILSSNENSSDSRTAYILLYERLTS